MSSQFQVMDSRMKNVKSLVTVLSLFAALAAGSAHAQVGGYIVAQQSMPYQPLSSGTVITPRMHCFWRRG